VAEDHSIYLWILQHQNICSGTGGRNNFYRDDIGEKIRTGLRLINSGIKSSPVKDTYRIGMPLSGDLSGRMSWDQTARTDRVYGTEGFLTEFTVKSLFIPMGAIHGR